jgi:predicted alpha/beta superfamily hydrolase
MDHSNNYPQVTLPGTETRRYHSEIIDQEFELYVSFPYKYFENDKHYPVIFCLDANRGYGVVNNTVSILQRPWQQIPEMLVVGIAYHINGLEDWVINRNRDFTPTCKPEFDKEWEDHLSKETGRNDILVRSGYAENFLKVLEHELIPFIDANYRTDPSDRILMGFSLGGLFVLYTIFKNHGLFHRCFAGSPSINWDEEFIFNLEKQFSESNQDLPIKLFISAGELKKKSMISNLARMEKLLNSRNFPGLELNTHIFKNETHSSCYPGSVSRAFRVLFNK